MDSEWPDRKEALSVVGDCGGEKRQDTAKAGARGEDGFSHTEVEGGAESERRSLCSGDVRGTLFCQQQCGDRPLTPEDD